MLSGAVGGGASALVLMALIDLAFRPGPRILGEGFLGYFAAGQILPLALAANSRRHTHPRERALRTALCFFSFFCTLAVVTGSLAVGLGLLSGFDVAAVYLPSFFLVACAIFPFILRDLRRRNQLNGEQPS